MCMDEKECKCWFCWMRSPYENKEKEKKEAEDKIKDNTWYALNNVNDSSLVHDENYLVCWKNNVYEYSNPHRAYWDNEQKVFFSLENLHNELFPLKVNAYMKLPQC